MIKNYDQLSSLEIDTLREIGSIGTGNAATALSQMMNKPVRITLPEVRIMEYNEAIEWIGGPEEVTAGVLVKMSGDIGGIMLSVQKLELVNVVLNAMLGENIDNYENLTELERSAMIEIGNIMISTFINALSGLADVNIKLTVPAFAVDMQGAIMAVPAHGVRWNVRLPDGHRRKFCVRRERGPLSSDPFSRSALFGFLIKEAGR